MPSRLITPEFPKLLEIFNIETKRKLNQYCSRLIVHQADLVALILGAQHGILHPYCYANYFDRRLPQHLFPAEAEHEALANNGTGAFKTKDAKKFVSKIFQLRKEQRSLAVHLFYTPNHNYWYLFYFDNRDIATETNHWKQGGSHIHLVCYLWPELKMSEVWKKAKEGNLNFPNSIHLRYKRR